ncbi:MAG: DUF1622 domain-containing protein [Pseudonocardiaceae bacterium]
MQGRPGREDYRRYRQGIGRAILLGLEFLVVGDIIHTVAVSPTFESVGVLATIVAIRTFLSMSLEVELAGRWPCNRELRRRRLRLAGRGQDLRNQPGLHLDSSGSSTTNRAPALGRSSTHTAPRCALTC